MLVKRVITIAVKHLQKGGGLHKMQMALWEEDSRSTSSFFPPKHVQLCTQKHEKPHCHSPIILKFEQACGKADHRGHDARL
mmetsp:Transcript_54003/g.89959  ORF Transcript_54003/g.89959 Transcript_54003/m.89959 type:complete len:81 (-) Transcript_54003:41-283(-)